MTELSKWEKASQAYMEEQEKSEFDGIYGNLRQTM